MKNLNVNNKNATLDLDDIVSNSLENVKDFLWSIESWLVTGFQFLVITIFFYAVTSVSKLCFECVSQLANRRKSWTCCIKLNNLLLYCQSTRNSPSHLWVQIVCNRVCDFLLPKQDKVDQLIHVQPVQPSVVKQV